MKNISFRYRFVLFFVLLEIMFVFMVIFVNFTNIHKSYENITMYKIHSIQSLNKNILKQPIFAGDIQQIDNIVSEFLDIDGVVAMKVWNSDGKLLSQNISNLQKAEKIIQISNRIKIADQEVGSAEIWLDLTKDQKLIDANQYETMIVIALEIFFSTLLAFYVGNQISESLNTLSESAEKIPKDINSAIPDLFGGKEITVLAKSLELMRKQLVEDRYELDHYRQIIDQDVVISRTDLDGNIVYVSQAFCEISGYERSELIGKNHRILRDPSMPDKVFQELWDTIIDNRIWHGELKNVRKDGESYWVDVKIFPWINLEGEKVGYIAVRHNITEKKIVEELSITDPLTKVYNRRYFDEIVPKFINARKRDNRNVTFLIMDIDYFKQYNDHYGHQMGDDVLIKVTALMKEYFKRSTDFCFRLGGEEFGVIFEALEKATAKEFTEKFLKKVEALHIEHSGSSVNKYVTVSVGFVCKNANEIGGIIELYKEADELLYKAKAAGRNRLETN